MKKEKCPKFQKCPNCNYLNETYPHHPYWLKCVMCGHEIKDVEPIEILDWEYELITNNENLNHGNKN